MSRVFCTWRVCAGIPLVDFLPTNAFPVFLPLPGPGLTQVPQIQKTEISFRMGEAKSYEAYVRSMVRFLEKYKDSAQKDDMIFEDCGSK